MHHLSFLWQAFTMCCVNMAMPIHLIDGKCHMKWLKAGKHQKTCLTITHSLYHATSYLWPRGWTHTHTHKHTDMQAKAISKTRPMRLQKTRFNYCNNLPYTIIYKWHQKKLCDRGLGTKKCVAMLYPLLRISKKFKTA